MSHTIFHLFSLNLSANNNKNGHNVIPPSFSPPLTAHINAMGSSKNHNRSQMQSLSPNQLKAQQMGGQNIIYDMTQSLI